MLVKQLINRSKALSQAQETIFDVLIIGGGITGAGILLDAQSRGLQTILFEKKDFASGTSSKSTKLVHGGLRYLKNLELKLVSESGRERNVLYRNAPHLVYPQKMCLPIYKQNAYGQFATSFALWFYDVLAQVKPQYRRSSRNRDYTLKHNPLLKKENLLGSVEYFEYRTNDARLVIENIKKASEFGALSFNYCTVEKIESDIERIQKQGFVHVWVTDSETNETYRIKTKTIVNATGIWAEEVLNSYESDSKNRLIFSKGDHIVVEKTKLPIEKAYYFELADGRMVFAIPAGNKTYIGTTDTVFKGDLDQLYAEKTEIQYLINSVNQFFDIKLNVSNVVQTWSGVRPLIRKNSKSLNTISRQDKIEVHHHRMISILGGKLTAYRKMAERVVDKLLQLNTELLTTKPCHTSEIKLSGGLFSFEPETHYIVNYIEQKFNEAYQLNIDAKQIEQLFYHYGSNLDLIINKAFDLYSQVEIDKNLVWLEAEIWYVVEHEFVIHLDDFLIRRSDRFFLRNETIRAEFDSICSIMTKYLSWTKEQLEIEIFNFNAIVDCHKY